LFCQSRRHLRRCLFFQLLSAAFFRGLFCGHARGFDLGGSALRLHLLLGSLRGLVCALHLRLVMHMYEREQH
jgi:hypothetical protein